MNVTLQPQVLRWARERAGLTPDALAQKLKVTTQQVTEWEKSGEVGFTRAEMLAKVTHTPFGYLFLPEPPNEPLPIHDFRTVRDEAPPRPSPDLLETIYTMQRRQAWMRDFLIEEGAEPLPFVASATPHDDPHVVAASIRDTLGLDAAWASRQRSPADALRHLRRKIDAVGILIVINGVVGNSNKRKLSVKEFRGFVLVDEYAPLIFINNNDAQTAKMFTFGHELAHLWLGAEGVTNINPFEPRLEPLQPLELVCNKIAAEFLVPEELFRARWEKSSQDEHPYESVARFFKVSQIVIARRAQELDLITRLQFFDFYNGYVTEEHAARPPKKGGDFWKTQYIRLGERFGRAILQATREGKLLYNDAYRLTGLKSDSFETLARQLEK